MAKNNENAYRLRDELHAKLHRGSIFTDDEIRRCIAEIEEGISFQSASSVSNFWLGTVVPICARKPHLAKELLIPPIRGLHAQCLDTIESIVEQIQCTCRQCSDAIERDWIDSISQNPDSVRRALAAVEEELSVEHTNWIREELSGVSQIPFERVRISTEVAPETTRDTWHEEPDFFCETTSTDQSCIWSDVSCGIVFFVWEILDWELANFARLTQTLSDLDKDGLIEIVVNGCVGFPLIPKEPKPVQTFWVSNGHVIANAPVGEVTLNSFWERTNRLIANRIKYDKG